MTCWKVPAHCATCWPHTHSAPLRGRLQPLAQHQWKRQWHRSPRVCLSASCPRPQHSDPQPPVPALVLSQARPRVPGASTAGSRSQKSGDFSK
ncbi:hypothetical protein SKAU_G00152220 [Synaphobranchus kaupii]|uniref:Uncharacterized protein n=1 Tax=Synaphobranchus kaupii TaxID=118154 RepID=A0A9Q1IZ29_SYNKA|nr:hypothetical protein SKAU_G00152220 [Synaphobranchus kaupii]